MGFVFSKLFGEKQAKIVMIGLNNAGKTSLLYRMQLGDLIQTAPTTSFNYEELTVNQINFKIWDLAGQRQIRKYWKSYYEGCKAVVFVVDCSDRAKLEQAGEEFDAVLTDK